MCVFGKGTRIVEEFQPARCTPQHFPVVRRLAELGDVQAEDKSKDFENKLKLLQQKAADAAAQAEIYRFLKSFHLSLCPP